MRNITINGNYKVPSDWKDEEISDRKDVQLESCQVVDRYAHITKSISMLIITQEVKV